MRSALCTVYSQSEGQTPCCIAVSPEGVVRYWPSIAHEGSSTDTSAELGGQKCYSLTNVHPVGCALATTTSTVLIHHTGHEVECRRFQAPAGLLGGIGRRMSCLLWESLPAGGQEARMVMKKCSRKFMPIRQWLYFDTLECLPTEKPPTEEDCALTGSFYDRQITVSGNNFQEKLGKQKYFVVKTGAIGCELIKNFAMIDLRCGGGGYIIVTDMDLIEKSNLNRQFLFRPLDIQKSKSVAAVKAINDNANVIHHENKVGAETENIYNDEFFADLDEMANALDNSSQDPPEKSIPICTLNNFPNSSEHTLQWARNMFEGEFTQNPMSASQYLVDTDYKEKTMKLPRVQLVEKFQMIKKLLVEDRPNNFLECVTWTRLLWQKLFHN